MIGPIEHYLGFDEMFFKESILCKREQSSRKYREFLDKNRKKISSVLLNKEKLDLWDSGLFSDLERLINLEILHEGRIRKKIGDYQFEIEPKNLYEKAGVTNLTEEQKRYISNVRVFAHLSRLMFPEKYVIQKLLPKELKGKSFSNSHCFNFAKDYIKFISNFNEEDCLGNEDFTRIIAAHNRGNFIFWTIAPYVHLSNLENGCDSQGSMKLIFNWLKDSNKNIDNGVNYKGDKMRESNDSYNPLLHTPRYCGFDKPLGFDDRMPSHLKSRLASLEISNKLRNN